MRPFHFVSQTSYQNGGFMCTSACACMCIKYLGKDVDLVHGRDNTIEQMVRSVMMLSSTLQGIAEDRLQGEHPGTEKSRLLALIPCRDHRMLSTFDFFSNLGVDPSKIGVSTEELVICRGGGDCVLKKSKVQGRPLIYESEGCFIGLKDLPKCMLSEGGEPVGCVLTCRGHSLCILQDGSGRFAVFDPMPSFLKVDMSSQEAVEEVARNRGFAGYGSGKWHKDPEQCDATLFYLKTQPA